MLRYALLYLRAVFGSLLHPLVRPYLVAAVSLIALGTVVFTLVEGWDPVDAAYFCVITLATVGYGDLTPATRFGKIFTMLYIVAGLGVLSTFVGALARVSVQQTEKRHKERVAKRKGEPGAPRSSATGPTPERTPERAGTQKG
jgi:hypothetical protein